MKVSTSVTLFHDRVKLTKSIACFWDRVSPLWLQLWGPHIHHGYFDKAIVSPVEAQERLMEKLIDLAGLGSGQKILDVGFGTGACSTYLAQQFSADVTGISLSRRQVTIAKERTKTLQRGYVHFLVDDALAMRGLADSSFDVVWSLESCEQFFDKPLFLRHAYRILKPGGKLMLATWCSSKEELEGTAAKDYVKLCRAFNLPYMPTMQFYITAFQAQGFELQKIEDWSNNVAKSWTAGIAFSKDLSRLGLVIKGGFRTLNFVRHLKLMQRGYKNRLVRYGVFLARKSIP